MRTITICDTPGKICKRHPSLKGVRNKWYACIECARESSRKSQAKRRARKVDNIQSQQS